MYYTEGLISVLLPHQGDLHLTHLRRSEAELADLHFEPNFHGCTHMWRKRTYREGKKNSSSLRGGGFENVKRLQREHIMRENNFYLGSSFILRFRCLESREKHAKKREVRCGRASPEPPLLPNDAL